MCVRLYPDIIVAVEIINTIQQNKLKICGNSNINTNEEFLQSLNFVYISIGRCIEQQMIYKQQMSTSNVFIGYGNNYWTKDDYKVYFEDTKQFFKLIDEDNLLYKVCIDKLCGEKKLSVSEIIKSVCMNLLFMDSYDKQILSDIGIYAD